MRTFQHFSVLLAAVALNASSAGALDLKTETALISHKDPEILLYLLSVLRQEEQQGLVYKTGARHKAVSVEMTGWNYAFEDLSLTGYRLKKMEIIRNPVGLPRVDASGCWARLIFESGRGEPKAVEIRREPKAGSSILDRCKIVYP